MFRRLVTAAALATLAFIAFATLCPVALRPEIGNVNLERFSAYALVGLLLTLAYPRHLILVISFIAVFAAVFEVLQLITPDRHGEFANALVKATGGAAGATAGFMVAYLARRDLDRPS